RTFGGAPRAGWRPSRGGGGPPRRRVPWTLRRRRGRTLAREGALCLATGPDLRALAVRARFVAATALAAALAARHQPRPIDQRGPAGVSSSETPAAANASRISSAAAKSLRLRASVRCFTM